MKIISTIEALIDEFQFSMSSSPNRRLMRAMPALTGKTPKSWPRARS